MADLELCAEVLLLVHLADLQRLPALQSYAVINDGEADTDDLYDDNGPREAFEGMLAAAPASGVLPPDGVAWVREVDEAAQSERLELALTDEQRQLAEERLRDVDEYERFDARRVLERLGLVEPAADEPLDADVEEGPESLLELKAVLQGTEARGAARIVSVECYDGGVLVRWELAQEIPAELRGAHANLRDHFFERGATGYDSPTLSDDAGTAYLEGSGGGGSYERGGRWVTEFTSTFSPGPAPDATTLSVELAGERFDFPIAGVAGRPGV